MTKVNPQLLISADYPEDYPYVSVVIQTLFRAILLPFFELIEEIHNQQWAPDLLDTGVLEDKAQTVSNEFLKGRGIDIVGEVSDDPLARLLTDVFIAVYPPLFIQGVNCKIFISNLTYITENTYVLVTELQPTAHNFYNGRKRLIHEHERGERL